MISSFLTPSRRALFAVPFFAVIGACSNGQTSTDTTPGDATVEDVGQDGFRGRDLANDIFLDSASCTVRVTPQSGAPSDTYMIEGQGFPGTFVNFNVSREATQEILVQTVLPLNADGSFMTTVTSANVAPQSLTPGTYLVHAQETSFQCEFQTHFLVTDADQ